MPPRAGVVAVPGRPGAVGGDGGRGRTGHQIDRPSSAASAGTSTIDRTNADSRIPSAVAKPISWVPGAGLTARLPNEAASTRPAVAMAGAVCRTARATAARAGPGRSISSRIRSLIRML
ncbi:hypothetical protein GCM10020254_12270 [Streptomyces goshikiensis]